jgi:hypothetical protein
MKQAFVNRERSFFDMITAAFLHRIFGLWIGLLGDDSTFCGTEDLVTELQRRLWAFEPQIANSAERNRRSEGLFPHSLGRIRWIQGELPNPGER